MQRPALSTSALIRPATAILGGTLIGVILQEVIWNLFNALAWATSLYDALLAGPVGAGLLWALIASWMAGGGAAGMMSTLIARHRYAGYISGALMTGSALLLIGLAWPGAGAVLFLAAVPALAAMLGAWAGQTLATAERPPITNWLTTMSASHALD